MRQNRNNLAKFAANTIEMGDPSIAGKGIAEIVKFIMRRIPYDQRISRLIRLKDKINNLNEMEMSTKNMPATSAIGQSISFVKTVLTGHNPNYIRSVLSNVIKHLP